MKNILFLTFFAAILITGCTGNTPTGPQEPVPVNFMGDIIRESGTDAIVNPGEAFTAQVVASANANDFTNIYASGNEVITPFDQTVDFSATGEGTIDPVQYYPINGGYIYIRGFAPVPVAPRTGNIVPYVIDGTQDIMVSNVASGNKNTTTPQQLTFNHLLTQVNFEVIALNAAAVAHWGNILSIEVLDQPRALNLNLSVITSELTPASNPLTGPITALSSPVTLSTTAAQAGQVMFYPMSVSPAGPLKLRITSVNVPLGHEISITTLPVFGNVLARGHSYLITLSFHETRLVAATVIPTPWSIIEWSSEMGD